MGNIRGLRLLQNCWEKRLRVLTLKEIESFDTKRDRGSQHNQRLLSLSAIRDWKIFTVEAAIHLEKTW